MAHDVPTVLGSGSLGLIYLPGPPRRLTREEIDERYPDLIPGLRRTPTSGSCSSAPRAGRWCSARPASATSPPARSPATTHWRRSARAPWPRWPRSTRYRTVADLMVNSRYDPELDEVAAFEDQVGSHGGLGGPQTHPFLLYPTELSAPPEPIFTSPAVHRVLKGWLVEVGARSADSVEMTVTADADDRPTCSPRRRAGARSRSSATPTPARRR